MYKQAIKVRPSMLELDRMVDRLEQKRKLHDVSAKVVLDIQNLEEQQNDILACAETNKKLLEYLRQGMTANVETIRKNIEYLKSKAAQN